MATTSLSVNAAALDHLALSPATGTITSGGSQAYTAQGRDQYNNSLGDRTSTTSFTIAPNGSCTGATCTALQAGAHTVTGTNTGKTGTASLTVTAGTANHILITPVQREPDRGWVADLHRAVVRFGRQSAGRRDGVHHVHDHARR